MNTIFAVYNGKTLTVKRGKETLLSLESVELNGSTDSRLEQNGYARVSPWTSRGRYKRAKLLSTQ